MAWFDRGVARDLYDLGALAELGHLTVEAAEVFARYGPTNGRPKPFLFARPPTELEWRSQLAAQTRLVVTASQAIETVREAWASALGNGWS